MNEGRSIVRRFLLICLVSFVVGIALFGAYYYYQSQNPLPAKQEKKKDAVTQKPSPSLTPVSSPTITPMPTIDSSDYKVQVLNGTGGSGVARQVKSILADIGLSEVTLGNAETFDYIDTQIRLKEKISNDTFAKIKTALIEYTVVKGVVLLENSTYDIIIVVGEKKEADR